MSSRNSSRRFGVMGAAASMRLARLLWFVPVFAFAPAQAQMDLAGDWRALMHEDREERIPGPQLGEFFGIPINDSARWRAELWDASIQSLRLQQQVPPYPCGVVREVIEAGD